MCDHNALGFVQDVCPKFATGGSVVRQTVESGACVFIGHEGHRSLFSQSLTVSESGSCDVKQAFMAVYRDRCKVLLAFVVNSDDSSPQTTPPPCVYESRLPVTQKSYRNPSAAFCEKCKYHRRDLNSITLHQVR